MKYQIGMHDDCYIDINGEIHIPFPDRLIKEAKEVKQRLGSWPNGGYRYDTGDIMIILYGRIAELELNNAKLADIILKWCDRDFKL